MHSFADAISFGKLVVHKIDRSQYSNNFFVISIPWYNNIAKTL